MSVDGAMAAQQVNQPADGGSIPTSTLHLKKGDWRVRDVSIGVARDMVERFHYARGASNTRTYLHGLFPAESLWEAECAAVAWWIPPTRSAAEATFPDNWRGVLSLSRLVVAPGVPKNACSFLIAHSARQIPKAVWPCLVTYADDWQGHDGAIYRAAGWTYVGKTKPEPTFTIGGVMTARKAGGRTRTRDEMLSLGARHEGSHAKHKFVLVRR